MKAKIECNWFENVYNSYEYTSNHHEVIHRIDYLKNDIGDVQNASILIGCFGLFFNFHLLVIKTIIEWNPKMPFWSK